MKSKKVTRTAKAKVESKPKKMVEILYPLGTKVTTDSGRTLTVRQTPKDAEDVICADGKPKYRPLKGYQQYPDFYLPDRINLLQDGQQNNKTKKNDNQTYTLSLSAYTQNSFGINICPKASAGCADACLITSSANWAYPSNVTGKIARADFYLVHKKIFLIRLLDEIVKTANKHKGQNVVYRLNVLSDLPFVEEVTKLAQQMNVTIPKNVIFYDYTKIPSKAGVWTMGTGNKYYVTFSLSEENRAEAYKFLKGSTPMLVAPVFEVSNQNIEKTPQNGIDFPYVYDGYMVLDGDESDDRMIDDYNWLISQYKAKKIATPTAWLGLRGKKTRGKIRTSIDTNGFFIADWKNK